MKVAARDSTAIRRLTANNKQSFKGNSRGLSQTIYVNIITSMIEFKLNFGVFQTFTKICRYKNLLALDSYLRCDGYLVFLLIRCLAK